MTRRYVIVTPVRDEEKHVAATIESVLAQTVLPAEWTIVDDGSTDATGRIIDDYAARYPFIRPVHRPNRGFRKAGGGVMEAFHDGYNAIKTTDWEFIVKLDADLSFGPDYFARCFEYFRRVPDLGIGGGQIYHELSGQLKLEAVPKFHVRGATKIYRRSCWEAIGGLWKAPGWDTIDEVKANMLGWKTYSFEDLQLLHHRFTGSAEGLTRDCVKHGAVCYICGYHPLFFAASCLYRLFRKPYLTGSFSMVYGYIKASLTDTRRVDDRRFIRYIRAQQMRRLCGMETVWK